MKRTAIVVGAGLVGLGVAAELMRDGWQVTVLEQGPADGVGTSHGNAGMLVPSHFVPLATMGFLKTGLRMMLKRGAPVTVRWRPDADLLSWVTRFTLSSLAGDEQTRTQALLRLSLASRDQWERWADDFPHLARPGGAGLMMIARTAHGLEEEAEVGHQGSRLGLDVEILDADSVRRRQPGLEVKCEGGVWFGNDAHVAPHEWVQAMRHSLGSNLVSDTKVLGWQLSGDRWTGVKTNHGAMCADQVVLASGFESAQMARSLGVNMAIQPGRGYGYTLPGGARLTTPSLLVEDRVSLTPMGESLRVTSGMEIGATHQAPDPARVAHIRAGAERVFPGLASADWDQPLWTGWRPLSADGLPYIGRVPNLGNAWVATGHGMMGISLAAGTGRMLADLMGGHWPSVDPEAFRLDR